MSSKRGRKRNDNLPPNRARDVQRAFRERRAAHLAALEERVSQLEDENAQLREMLHLPPSDRPPLGRGPTGADLRDRPSGSRARASAPDSPTNSSARNSSMSPSSASPLPNLGSGSSLWPDHSAASSSRQPSYSQTARYPRVEQPIPSRFPLTANYPSTSHQHFNSSADWHTPSLNRDPTYSYTPSSFGAPTLSSSSATMRNTLASPAPPSLPTLDTSFQQGQGLQNPASANIYNLSRRPGASQRQFQSQSAVDPFSPTQYQQPSSRSHDRTASSSMQLDGGLARPPRPSDGSGFNPSQNYPSNR